MILRREWNSDSKDPTSEAVFIVGKGAFFIADYYVLMSAINIFTFADLKQGPRLSVPIFYGVQL